MKNKMLYFQEYQKFDFDKINSLLSNDEIKSLFEKKILKLGKDNKYYFEYVGILSLKNSMFILLPKYLSKDEILIERKENSSKIKTKLLIKVLKKYFSKNLNETFLYAIGEEESNANLDKFALYDYLISDFIEYGFYENQKKVYEINGDGEINWKKTIEECQEFIIGDNLLYLDYYSNEVEADDKDYIKNLHKYYLNKASEFFKDISFLDLDYPIFNFEILDNFIEDISIQILKIKKTLQEEFSERKIRLLKLLLILIENDSYKVEESINFYGTIAFYDVWEKACGSILGNQYEKYMNYISKPVWSDNIGNSATRFVIKSYDMLKIA